MNIPEIDFHENYQQNQFPFSEFNTNFIDRSFRGCPCNNMGIMGLYAQNQEGGGPQQLNFLPARPSSTIMGRFESPASAFYATERFMGFSQQFPPYEFSRENCPIVLADQQETFDFEMLTNTLQPAVRPHVSGNVYHRSSPGKSQKISSNTFPGSKIFQQDQSKLFADVETSPAMQQISAPFRENQDHKMNFSCKHESSSGSVSTGTALKTRIRWTQDLHEKFVECVNRLGGAEKATPKAILKLMDSEGLTIFHVKSHLQKYRIAKYIPDSAEGKSERRTSNSVTEIPRIDVKTGLQIREALQLQLDVQMRLHEQLEIQRTLQLQIEEQGRQLQMMFDQQQKTSKNLFKTQNLDTTPPDDSSFNRDEAEISHEEIPVNTQFSSKIS